MKNKLFFVLAMLFCASLLSAQSADAKRFALVIGNQTYDESPLANPRADSKLISEALKDCGFDVTLKQDLNGEELAAVIADYADKIENEGGNNSISFFYYSGHGLQIGGKNYMVPVNDKNITSEARAKSLCYSIDSLLELIPSSTQVVVLDACRNNPFKTTKGNFSKGLTRIATPKNSPNFLTLFSTGDGATADDGTGKNSLFTECLAKRIHEYNTEVLAVFNEVADDVKTKTSGRQTPLVAGTSVKFEFMNAKIAENKIKELQSQQKAIDSDKTKKNSKEYDSEKKMLAADIELMKEKKAASEKDAKEKASRQKAEDDKRKSNQKEMERQQKEAEKQRKEFQAQKAKEKSSLTFIKEIEDNKERIQNIRSSVAEKIYSANCDVQHTADEKMDEIYNAPLKITEKDKKGNMNSDTKKKRKAATKAVQDDADVEKKKNFDRYYDTIKEEESERIVQLEADEKTLSGAKYEMSSFMNEVEYELSTYDGEKNRWLVYFNSNFLERKDLFKGSIEITYEQLCTKILGQKYVEPKKMNDIDSEQYAEDVELYDRLFKDTNSPLNVVVEYKVSPSSSGVSRYDFSTVSVSVNYMKDGEEILLNQKSFSQSEKLQWKEKQTEIKDVPDLIKGYEKEDSEREKAAKKAEKEKSDSSSGGNPFGKIKDKLTR